MPVLYRSTTGRTVAMGRYHITPEGTEFLHPVQELDDILGAGIEAIGHPKDGGDVDTLAEIRELFTRDPVTGVVGLSQLVISTAAPDDNDGRPDGTVYLQVL